MQRGEFPVKIFLSDDGSTDGTREICQKYKEQHPDRIYLLMSEENTKGKIVESLYDKCFSSGVKYVAMCEGDDYWTDPRKLIKQVELLESDLHLSVAIHSQAVIFDGMEGQNFVQGNIFCKKRVALEDVLACFPCNFTASLLFRNPKTLPSWFYTTVSRDHALLIWLATFGDIYFMDDVMAVYRQHPAGITKTIAKKPFEELIAVNERKTSFLVELDGYFNKKYSSIIRKHIFHQFEEALTLSRLHGRRFSAFRYWLKMLQHDYARTVRMSVAFLIKRLHF